MEHIGLIVQKKETSSRRYCVLCMEADQIPQAACTWILSKKQVHETTFCGNEMNDRNRVNISIGFHQGGQLVLSKGMKFDAQLPTCFQSSMFLVSAVNVKVSDSLKVANSILSVFTCLPSQLGIQ